MSNLMILSLALNVIFLIIFLVLGFWYLRNKLSSPIETESIGITIPKNVTHVHIMGMGGGGGGGDVVLKTKEVLDGQQ